MSQTEPLKSRHREILNAIVRNYIETGEPVGSHSIARSRHQNSEPGLDSQCDGGPGR